MIERAKISAQLEGNPFYCPLARMFIGFDVHENRVRGVPKIALGVFPRSDYNKIWQGYSGVKERAKISAQFHFIVLWPVCRVCSRK